MTAKTDFTEEEWKLVLAGPAGAGMLVMAAQRGGTFRESFSMAKAYTDARRNHGQSALLDEIVATKPEVDHTRFHSVDELREAALKHLREAVALLGHKATADELEQYRQFVLSVANRVAESRKDGFLGLGGERVSESERAALDEIAAALS